MAALPSLRQLSYLVTLSETLHFTEAARRSLSRNRRYQAASWSLNGY